MKTKPILRLGAFILPALFSTGCVTHTLWENRDFYEPAPDAKMQIYQAAEGREMLMEYDELKKNDAIRRRAYYLYANQKKIGEGKKPAFVAPKASSGLNPIPVARSGSLAPINGRSGLYAVADSGQNVAIYSGNQRLSTHALPVYQDPVQHQKQVMLTPLAVVADGVLITVTLGLILWHYTGYNP